MLNKYIYKTNKEFYNCNIDIIIIKISKCLKAEKYCKNNGNQNGGGTNNKIVLPRY